MKKVAVVVQDGAEPFGLGSMVEVWGEEYHPEDDNPVFDFVVVAPEKGLVRSRAFDLHVEHDLSEAADADLVCLIPVFAHRSAHPEVLELARATHERGAFISSHCSGAFQLGLAGLLDGRECTTHWRYTDELAEMFPEAKVKPEVLYVLDDHVLTGAGSAAGIDAALFLMRQELGADAAAGAARRIVLPPHRDGGQAQFIRQPMPECSADTLAPLLAWIVEHLDEDLSVGALAARSAMSERTFARRFVEETGATPHGWVTAQRVRRAEHLLERSDLPVERVAHQSGFASAATLRHQFTRVRGISPQEYRRRFC